MGGVYDMSRIQKVEIIRCCPQNDDIFQVRIDGNCEDKVGVDALYKCLDEIFKPKQKDCLHLDDMLVPCYDEIKVESKWDKVLKI